MARKAGSGNCSSKTVESWSQMGPYIQTHTHTHLSHIHTRTTSDVQLYSVLEYVFRFCHHNQSETLSPPSEINLMTLTAADVLDLEDALCSFVSGMDTKCKGHIPVSLWG